MGLGTAIMLLPEDSTGDEHLTLVYCGDGSPSRNMHFVLADLTQRLAVLHQPIEAWITSVAKFDVDGGTEVYIIGSPLIEAMRFLVAQYAISQWGFSPHIAKVKERAVDSMIRFNRIGLWVDGEHTNYRLGSGARCA